MQSRCDKKGHAEPLTFRAKVHALNQFQTTTSTVRPAMVLKLDAGDSGTKQLLENFERKIARNHKANQNTQPKTQLNRFISQSFAKQGSTCHHFFLQQSPVTRRNLEWPLLRAPRHAAFAQLTFFCRCSMVFRCFLPNKCQGRGYFSMLMQHMGQKGPCWATYTLTFRAEVHALNHFKRLLSSAQLDFGDPGTKPH